MHSAPTSEVTTASKRMTTLWDSRGQTPWFEEFCSGTHLSSLLLEISFQVMGMLCRSMTTVLALLNLCSNSHRDLFLHSDRDRESCEESDLNFFSVTVDSFLFSTVHSFMQPNSVNALGPVEGLGPDLAISHARFDLHTSHHSFPTGMCRCKLKLF